VSLMVSRVARGTRLSLRWTSRTAWTSASWMLRYRSSKGFVSRPTASLTLIAVRRSASTRSKFWVEENSFRSRAERSPNFARSYSFRYPNGSQMLMLIPLPSSRVSHLCEVAMSLQSKSVPLGSPAIRGI
jgi:hypothetical protein